MPNHCNHYLESLRRNNLTVEGFILLMSICEPKLKQGENQYFCFDNIYELKGGFSLGRLWI